MNEFNKIDQIRNILLVLEEQKKSDITKLNRIKYLQQRKIESVNKIMTYKKEYEEKNKNSVSATVPALYRNYEMFMHKLDDAIRIETGQIESFEHEKIEMITKLEQLELKIKAIQDKLGQAERVLADKLDMLENMAINELSVQAKIKD